MECKNCGKPLKDGDRFCGSCGARVEENRTVNSTQNPTSGYTFYEKFGPDATESMMKVVKSAVWLPSLISSSVSSADKIVYEKGIRKGDTIIKSFIITDRSLIFKGNEYSSDLLSVIVPVSKTEMKVSVSGEEIFLSIDKNDFLRLYNAIIRLNEKNKLVSKRQELLYAQSITTFLKEVYAIIRTLPVTFNEEKKFEKLYNYNEPVIVNDGAIISKENQQLLKNYEHAQIVLNDFYKKRNLFSEKYDFCKRGDNLKRIVNNMTESDNDLGVILQRLFNDEEEKSSYSAEDESGYLSDDSNDPNKHVVRDAVIVGAAIGVARKLFGKNRGRDGSLQEKPVLKDYYLTPACQQTPRSGHSSHSCAGCALAVQCKHAQQYGR